jgi:ACS family glucarate transporter-like MFS transporter
MLEHTPSPRTVERRRWLIPLLLFITNAVCFLDRVNLSVVAPRIAHDFALGPAAIGVLFSCFFYTYIPLLVPMGMLADRWGARIISTAGMLVWSVASALTGAAAGFSSAFAARVLLGAGEASNPPAGNRIIREWAPQGERARYNALFQAGGTAGPAIGFVVTSTLLATVSWQMSFYILAVLNLVWAAIWWTLYRSPEQAHWLSEDERQFVLASREAQRGGPVRKMRLSLLLRQPVMWGLLLTHGCIVYTIYLFLAWLPTYLATVRHLHLASVGWLGMAPYLVTTIGAIAIAAISDKLLAGRDLSRGVRRKTVIALMALASCVLFVPLVDNLVVMEVLVIAPVLFAQTASIINYALTGDLIVDRDSAGTVFGLLTFGGNTAAFIAPMLTGFIIAATGEYTLSFVLAAGLLLAGMAISWLFARRPLQPA